MLAAMAGFTLEDVFIKQLSSTISTGQILVTSGIVGTIFFGWVSVAKGHQIMNADAWTPATIGRMVGEAIAALAFVKALSLIPLSTVAAIFQITPLTITMGAALFLGERVGWRRWLAIFVGFIGVLLIIKPGGEGFNPSIIWIIIAVIGVASRDLITRIIPSQISSAIISFQAFIAVVLAGVVALLLSSDSLVAISIKETSLFTGAIVFGIAGYYAIVSAMRVGDASIVAPFRYTRLLFSLFTGMIIFNERLDAWSLLGAAIIIGTGLYTFLRERQLAIN